LTPLAPLAARKPRKRALRRLAGALLAVALGPLAAVSAYAAPSPLLPQSIRRSGVLTLATDAEYPPCESLAADNRTVIGFDADLWNAVAAKLGVRVQAVSTSFSGLISGVQSGRYAVAMSCISDSRLREGQVLFIDYAYATSAIFTLEANRKATADPLSLCGQKSAAEAGTDSIESLNLISTHCLRNKRAPIVILQFPSANGMFNALISRRVDFVLDDVAAADIVRKMSPAPIRMVNCSLLPRLYTGMIVAKGSDGLAAALLAGIRAIQADGTYGRVLKTWGIAQLALGAPGLNLAAQRPLPAPQP
jgi:polar amino acid transport system substrate-binding protein